MPDLRVPRILWVAFIAVQPVLAVVGVLVGPGSTEPLPAAIYAGVWFTAATQLVVLALAPRLFGSQPVFTAWLVKYALCETIGFFGFALMLLGGDPMVALPLHGLAVLALISQLPTAERFTRWELARLGG